MAESSNSNKDTELTMCDVLQEEQELEEDANAVLGGSDDTNCSYDEGYVPRQALYACKTCKINGEAGVCLACCYACHDGHEVVELYTKRNFRCDCGNSKFTGKTCTLRSDKEPLNTENNYNHNFKGLYCRCSRPYPDLEDDTPDEMIQCVFCEDWYHGRHLGVSVPDDYFEMICEKCMQANKFLYRYLNMYNVIIDVEGVKTRRSTQNKNDSVNSEVNDSVLSESANDSVSESANVKSELANDSVSESATANVKSELANDCVSEMDVDNVKSESLSDNVKSESLSNNVKSESLSDDVKSESLSDNVKSELANGDFAKDIFQSPETKKDEDNKKPTTAAIKEELNGNTPTCLLNTLKTDGISTGSAFWPENWRQELCKCANCMAIYANAQCEFLLNPDDTIQAYEERGKGKSGQSQYDKGLNALSQLDRVKQMEAVRAYTSMKGQLKEYLKEFADNKRTVCESDIKEFFERIGKKQKLNNGIPHFCR